MIENEETKLRHLREHERFRAIYLGHLQSRRAETDAELSRSNAELDSLLSDEKEQRDKEKKFQEGLAAFKRTHLCKCGREPKIQDRNYCRKCNAEYQKKRRATHPLTEDQRLRKNAHSYAWSMVKRGKLKKEPCEVCSDPMVKMYHDDPRKPLEVHWLCRAHRHGAARDLI